MKAPIRLIEYRSDQRLEKNEYLKSLSQLNAAFAGAMELLRKYRPEAYNDKPVSKKFVNELLKNPKEVLINELTSGIKIEGLTLSPAKILELQDINLKPVIAAFKDGKKAMDICRYAKGKFELVKSKLDAALQRHIVYTQTDREFEIAEACNEIVKSFDKLQELTDIRLNYHGLATATNGAINTYLGERCLHPEAIKRMAIKDDNYE